MFTNAEVRLWQLILILFAAIGGVAAYNNYKIKPLASSENKAEVVMDELSARHDKPLDNHRDNSYVDNRYSDGQFESEQW